MDMKDRIAAMTADIGALTLGQPVRFGADAGQRHAHSFAIDCDGKPLVEVTIFPRGDQEDQAAVDELALVLWSLLNGSEARVADAEERISNLRGACGRKDRQIADLERKLSDFEVSRQVRGPLYAAEDERGGVWLVGKPSWSAAGLHYLSWHELAVALPGLRACGVQAGEGKDAGTIFIVMQPIADLEPRTAAPGPA